MHKFQRPYSENEGQYQEKDYQALRCGFVDEATSIANALEIPLKQLVSHWGFTGELQEELYPVNGMMERLKYIARNPYDQSIHSFLSQNIELEFREFVLVEAKKCRHKIVLGDLEMRATQLRQEIQLYTVRMEQENSKVYFLIHCLR